MEAITRQEVIDAAPKRWKHQYPGGREGIYEKLMAAKPLTKEKVDTIIGNQSWTRLSCDECEKEVDSAITISNSETLFYVCKKCLNKALRLIDKKDAKH